MAENAMLQQTFVTLTFTFIPDQKCVELKSLKFYLQSYRNQGVFYERLTNEIVDDLVSVMKPRYLKLTSEFTPRGGLHSKVVVKYVAPGYVPPTDV